MKKRIFSFLLAAIMLVSLLPVTSLAAETGSLDNFKQTQTYADGTFSDVKAGDWFYENIASVYGLELMVGRKANSFGVDKSLTVAEAMTIAARLHAIYYTGKADFAQEKGRLWSKVYTDYCKANGIADPANYDLNMPVTRGQFADIFAHAFPTEALKKINTVQNDTIPDVKTADKFGAAVYQLYRAGILVGNDAKGTFAPESNIKRSEAAAISTRMAVPALRQSIRLVKPTAYYESDSEPEITKTIGQLLDTVDGGFPAFAGNIWMAAANQACFEEESILCFIYFAEHDTSAIGIAETDKATKSGSNYIYKDSGVTVTFVMTGDKLSSIVFDCGSAAQYGIYNGTYTAPTTFKAVYDTTGGANTLTFYYDNKYHGGENKTIYEYNSGDYYLFNDTDYVGEEIWGYNAIRQEIKSVKIDASVADYDGLTSTAYMFFDMGDAASITGAEYLDVSGVTDMSGMFDCFGRNSEEITSVPDVSAWDTSSVTNMSNMFNEYAANSTRIAAVPDVSDWNTASVTDMSGMFSNYAAYCEDFAAVPYVTDWDTGSVEDMTSLFAYFASSSLVLNEVPDVSDWNTASVTDLECVFDAYGYNSLALSKAPDVSAWNTESATDLSGVFWSYASCSLVLNEVPDVSAWDTSSATDLAHLFTNYGHDSTVLSKVPDVSAWDTTNTENMAGIFNGYASCSLVLDEVPDVSDWNTAKVEDMDSLFSNFAHDSATLTKVPDVSGWNTANVESVNKLFKGYGCSSEALEFILDLSDWNVDAVQYCGGVFTAAGESATDNNWFVTVPTTSGGKTNDAEHWYVGEGTDYIAPADGRSLAPSGPAFVAVYNTTDGANTLTFYYDEENHRSEGTVYRNLPDAATAGTDWGYNGIREEVKSVVIDESVANYEGLTSTAFMFANMWAADSFAGAQYLNTKDVTNMQSTFVSFGFDSTTLTDVPDVSGWNTANVENMNNVFSSYGYKSSVLASAPDVSKWDTAKVRNMATMFKYYGNSSTALTAVPDVSGWNTANVEDMSNLFYGYGKTSTVLNFTLDLTGWDVGKVTGSSTAFSSAGAAAATWSVTIPGMTGSTPNTAEYWYAGDGTDSSNFIYAGAGKAFTPNLSTFKAVYDTTDGANVLTFYYDNVDHSSEGTVYDKLPDAATAGADWGYNGVRGEVKSVVIDASVADYEDLTSTAFMFADMSYAESFAGAQYLNTKDVTNMQATFSTFGYFSTTLTAVPDVSGWNTANVENMNSVFNLYGFLSGQLASAPDVSKWDTAKVTDMSEIFNGYGQASTALTDAPDVSGWNTANVTDMANIFASYGKTSAVLDFTLDLTGWDVGKVTSFNAAFTNAGAATATWSVTIPGMTGSRQNTTQFWYVGDGTDATKFLYAGTKTFTPNLSTFKAVYDTTDGANVLTFYYDNVDHSGTNKTVYENGTGNDLFTIQQDGTAYWKYTNGGVRGNIKAVVIDSSVADYHGLTDTYQMFWNMKNASSITGAEYLDVSNVTNMESMFEKFGYNAESNISAAPNVSGWDTGKVVNMKSMFSDYGNDSTALTNAPDVSNWDTSNVTDMKTMFDHYGKTSTVLNFTMDLSGWDVSSVTSYENVFYYAGKNASTWSVEIPKTTGTAENTTEKWFVGDGTDPEKFIKPQTDKQFTPTGPKTFKAVYDTTSGANTLTFYYDAVDHSGTDKKVYCDDAGVQTDADHWLYDKTDDYVWGYSGGTDITDDVKSIIIDPSMADYYGLTDASYMFSYFRNVSGITDMKYLNTGSVTDMSYMFYNFASNLSTTLELDLSTLDTSSVTNMQGMFEYFARYTTCANCVPDVSKFDTSNVTDMSRMFACFASNSNTVNCVPDVSKWDTSSVTNMESMFWNFGQTSQNFDFAPAVSNWDTSSVTNMNYMFCGYAKGSTVLNNVPDVSNWDMSNATTLKSMFEGYGKASIKLSTVPDISGWNISKVTDVDALLQDYGDTSEELVFVLDLSNWNVASITSTGSWTMFKRTNSTPAKTWAVTIPAKTGDRDNTATKWYLGNGTNTSVYASSATGQSFTLAN